MKKRYVFVAAVIAALCAFTLACTPIEKEPLVIKESDKHIVITADSDRVSITNDTTLLDYMNSLKQSGELEFEIADGMVVSVNGIANAAPSYYWMLYTSDADNANAAWGTAEYKGEKYGSAMFGAEKLKIKNGEIYIWVYQSFQA